MLIKFLSFTGKPDIEIDDLSGANLSGANLSGADLSDANLSGANLSRANLSGANLSGANLSRADLSRANLSGANLSRAYLIDANLRRAYLSGANLSRADLIDANLSGANLSGANLIDANLSRANLTGARGLARQIVVTQGTLQVYKKLADGQIATLLVPSFAARVNAYGSRKCRSSEAYVLTLAPPAHSKHDGSFVYREGITVKPIEPFCDDPRIECASGIHWFITRQEAEEYN
jgi:Pentapeptide repeats (8 copies)/Family of unknown function (DUF5758)